MAEGGIYLCNWTASNGDYKLQLRANPKLESSGRDLEQCKEEICLQIIDWNGDGEAVLELFPPPGNKLVAGGAILFARVAYNDSVRVLRYESLFKGGACPVCKFGIDTRSDAALRLESGPKGMTCSIDACYPLLLIFKKRFVELLSNQELACFEIRPVFLDGNETDYIELIGKRMIRTVGYRGANYPSKFQQSFKCSECDREKFTVEADGFEYGTSFIDANDIDADPSTMIVVDDGWRQAPAFRLGRWQQLLEQAGSRSLLSEALVVLDSNYVERPVLKACNEFDWVM